MHHLARCLAFSQHEEDLQTNEFPCLWHTHWSLIIPLPIATCRRTAELLISQPYMDRFSLTQSISALEGLWGRYFHTQSTSALDRWRDRAIGIARGESLLAFGLVILGSSYYPKPSEFEYNHPPMTRTKLAVALPTIFLPVASCYAAGISTRHRVRIQHTLVGKPPPTRARVKPLIYSSFQILQLIACSFLAAYDFVRFSARRRWFHYSLAGLVMPALAGTIFGLVGIARFLFAGSAHLTLRRYRSPTAGEEYSDDAIEHCALEQAYQQQLPENVTEPELAGAGPADGYLLHGESILYSQLRHEETECTRPQNNQHPENNATTQEPDTSQTLIRDDQIRSRHPASPRTQPRFRWQEQTGVHNGGRAFWAPISVTTWLAGSWFNYYKWLIRHSPVSQRCELLLAPNYIPQAATCKRRKLTNINLPRLLALIAFAPIAISILSHAALICSLRRPLLLLIFTSFCFSVLASAIWFAEFVYSFWFFFNYMRQIPAGFNFLPFVLILMSFGMTCCHLALLRCSVMMEWTPGYSSLLREYKLWKERRGEAGADREEYEDEET